MQWCNHKSCSILFYWENCCKNLNNYDLISFYIRLSRNINWLIFFSQNSGGSFQQSKTENPRPLNFPRSYGLCTLELSRKKDEGLEERANQSVSDFNFIPSSSFTTPAIPTRPSSGEHSQNFKNRNAERPRSLWVPSKFKDAQDQYL